MTSILSYTDTHCHLDFNVFNKDREEVLAASRNGGITRMLNPAVDVASSRAIVDRIQHEQGVFAAVGVHPNDASSWDDDSLSNLKQLVRRNKVVAIGEIGLDYYRDRAPRDLQREIFEAQLDLAQEARLPVIIHTRQSIPDTLAILADWLAELKAAGNELATRPGVLHSFSGSEQEARQAIEMGFWIGLTGPVTFKNAKELQSIVSCLPIEHLLLETDAPFLTPHPRRGQRNEPLYVHLIAEKVAELQKRTVEEVARITTANAERLFAWRELG